MNAKEHYAQKYHLQYTSNADNYWLYGYIKALGVKSVFEFGCNVGRHLVELRKQGCQVDGLDVNPRAVEGAKLLHNLDVRLGDELQLADLKDGSFDLVLTNSVLSHMPTIGDTVNHLLRIARRHAIFVETRSRADDHNYWWIHTYPGKSVRNHYSQTVNAVYQVWHVQK